MNNPQIASFFDPQTWSYSHVISDPATHACAVVDPVWNYDANTGRTSTDGADDIINYVETNDLHVDWILETHAHADHLTASRYIQRRCGGRTGIAASISTVQTTFAPLFNVEPGFACDGSQFDVLFIDGQQFSIGQISATAMATPGHTPACMTYIAGNAAFVGDTIFMPDYGTARCDFPGGDAHDLYRSIQKIYALPDDTRLLLCHDYGAPGRDEFCGESTVAAEKADNIHVNSTVTEDAFVAARTARDKTLPAPRLLLPSIQVNMRAGELPPAEGNGRSYLKIPLNAL